MLVLRQRRSQAGAQICVVLRKNVAIACLTNYRMVYTNSIGATRYRSEKPLRREWFCFGRLRREKSLGGMAVNNIKADSQPIYIRLQKDLLRLVQDGEVKRGGRFPSERELSLRFGASRMTTRKAVDHLVQSGILERRGTSGTYVPDRLFDRPLSSNALYSVSEAIAKSGHTPGSKLLFFERKDADDHIASKLGIAPGDPVISMERQRTVDGIAVCVEFSHIPAKLVPGFAASDVTENQSIYKVFRDRYGLDLRKNLSVISIHRATKVEAEALGLRPNASVLYFEGLSSTQDGQPFEYLRSLNHPDRVSFTIQQSPESNASSKSNPVQWMLDT